MKIVILFILTLPLLLLAQQTASAIKFVVSKDKRSVEKTEKGKFLRAYDVVSKCGEPFVGKPEILKLTVSAEKVLIIYGKHDFAEIDIRSDNIKCLGSD